MDILREKIINKIPRRTSFLNKDIKIEPSEEEKYTVKEIAQNKKIYLEYPIEDPSDTMEFEIFLNGKSYIKKEFYPHIKVKYVRINLKFDQTYKLCYMKGFLSPDEENVITLDELCYKELKVYFVKLKNDLEQNNIKTSYTKEIHNYNLILETKSYPHKIFRNHEKYDIWIFIGKEKSGKTTFINCLCNYMNKIKYEDNFRYSIEAKKQNGYQIYDIQDDSLSQKIRAIEFPGFSGCLEEDKIINGNIKSFIKAIKEIQLICFVISGNETRLTDDLKNIFSNVWDIFSIDIKNNFLFIITNCDAKQPPVLDSINNSEFSKFLPKSNKNWFFKFNNSYLYEANQKEFWDVGIAHYDEFMNNITKIEKISLKLTKNYIDLYNQFRESSKNFIVTIKKVINYRYYYNILKNINSYDNNSNEEIPFDFYEVTNICAQCGRAFANGQCRACGSNKYREQKYSHKKACLQYLRRNKKIYFDCYNRYKIYLKENIIHSALLFKALKDFYQLKLVNNSHLKNDLREFLDKNEKDKKNINKEIQYQDELYKDYISKHEKESYQKFLDIKIIIE